MDFVMSCLSVGENGNLSIGGCDVAALAEEYGTPAYIMDEDQIRENCRVYNRAMQEYYGGNGIVLYASKALSCKYIYRMMKEENMGIDVVSGWRDVYCLKSRIPGERYISTATTRLMTSLKWRLRTALGE